MAKESPKAVRTIRKLRHWKQRFDPTARFLWRKRTEWSKLKPDGSLDEVVVFPPGSLVPEWVQKQMGGAKLSRFWESNFIELHQVDEYGAPALQPSPTAAEEIRNADAEREIEPPAPKKKTGRRKKPSRRVE